MMTTANTPNPETDAPSGPVRRLRAALALALDGLAALGPLAWLLGRVLSDRFLWSQYLEWIPTELAVLASGVPLALASALRARRPRLVPGAALALVLVWMLAGEYRLHRVVLPAPERGSLRVAFMNISHRGGAASLDPLFDADADIVVLSNVHPQPISFERIYGVTHPSLMERTIGLVPGTAPAGEAHMVRAGYFHAYSAHPIRRWASAYLGTQESWLEDDTRGGGSVLMLEIDAPDGPLIVWAVDMPSTIGASRRDMFERMRAEVDAVARVSAIDPVGRWRPGELGEQDPLRTPDLIVGDFNTPSHAWSVRRFARGTRDARADAGVGPPGTFPAAGGVPLFPIDAARLGPSVRATHARSVRCDGCRHLGLVLDLERPG